MPSGKTARPHITDNKDGTITIKYQPTERGLHEMDIKYEGNHIPGQTVSVWKSTAFKWSQINQAVATFNTAASLMGVSACDCVQQEALCSSLWML